MEQKRFYYPTYLHSGDGAIQRIADYLADVDRVMLITDCAIDGLGLTLPVENVIKQKTDQILKYTNVMPNPEIAMIYEAVEIAKQNNITAIVAVGGGSVMDAAKAVAMISTQPLEPEEYGERKRAPSEDPIPLYVVPTTSGTGSEGSSVAVISYGEKGKAGLWSDKLFAKAAFIDVDLMMNLPPMITATTAMDALDHAVEAYIGLDRQPVLDALSLHAIKLIALNIEKACSEGSRMQREQLSQGAFMAGLAMGQSGTGIVHSMADRLGDLYHVPHGMGIAMLLPVCLEYNMSSAVDRIADIARAMELDISGKTDEEAAEMAVKRIFEIKENIGIPNRVEGEPISDELLTEISEITLNHFITDNNPKRPTVEDLKALFLTVLPEKK